ncbi:hypothetical protein BJV74DRAFT_798698 [Russula compacta]|nr:hypothetical protein BJV74DRAFT_798698 [Russula compacta]
MAKKKARSKPPPIINIFNGDLNMLNAGSNSAKTGKKGNQSQVTTIWTTNTQQDLKIKEYRQQIIDLHACSLHTLSDQDLLFWAMLVHTGEATIDRKPARVNAFTNGPCHGTGNSCTNSAPTPNISNLYQLPYGTHPPPHHMMPWVMLPAVHYPQMPIYHLNTMMLPGAPYSDLAGYLKVPQAAAPVICMPLNVPAMKPWLQYYDNHLAHSSPTQLSNLCSALEAKGFICIDQLDGPGIDVEKIMSWIDVPPGVTLLLYRYAKEDMVLVHARQFSMDTPVASGSQG